MEIQICWEELKSLFVSRILPLQWFQDGSSYIICVKEGTILLYCRIVKTESPNDTQIDFETNFKTNYWQAP
jgi:hypothetical protein